MMPTPASKDTITAELVAFGAHPDDIEFGCGGVIAAETQSGHPAHLVVCSHGEAATHGTAAQRDLEALRAAEILGATLEFLDLDGDAHLEIRSAHALALAAVLRRVRPRVVLAPSLMENQHPDHWRLGKLVRDAVRLARYGGVQELMPAPPHAVEQLLYYALTPESEPDNLAPVWIDVSTEPVLTAWKQAMQAHASQVGARRYVDLQISRAQLRGLRAGLQYAIALYPNDPLVFSTLSQLQRSARGF